MEQKFKFTPQSNEDSLFWKQKKEDLILYVETEKTKTGNVSKKFYSGYKIIAFFGLYKNGDIATAKHYVGGFIKDESEYEKTTKNEFDKSEKEYSKREIETGKENSKVKRKYLI